VGLILQFGEGIELYATMSCCHSKKKSVELNENSNGIQKKKQYVLCMGQKMVFFLKKIAILIMNKIYIQFFKFWCGMSHKLLKHLLLVRAATHYGHLNQEAIEVSGQALLKVQRNRLKRDNKI